MTGVAPGVCNRLHAESNLLDGNGEVRRLREYENGLDFLTLFPPLPLRDPGLCFLFRSPLSPPSQPLPEPPPEPTRPSFFFFFSVAIVLDSGICLVYGMGEGKSRKIWVLYG